MRFFICMEKRERNRSIQSLLLKQWFQKLYKHNLCNRAYALLYQGFIENWLSATQIEWNVLLMVTEILIAPRNSFCPKLFGSSFYVHKAHTWSWFSSRFGRNDDGYNCLCGWLVTSRLPSGPVLGIEGTQMWHSFLARFMLTKKISLYANMFTITIALSHHMFQLVLIWKISVRTCSPDIGGSKGLMLSNVSPSKSFLYCPCGVKSKPPIRHRVLQNGLER
jgi:hypothetical protein